MESRSVFQAKIQAKFFSIELGPRRRSSNPEIDLSRRRSLAIIERNRNRRRSVTHQAFLIGEAKQEIREMHR